MTTGGAERNATNRVVLGAYALLRIPQRLTQAYLRMVFCFPRRARTGPMTDERSSTSAIDLLRAITTLAAKDPQDAAAGPALMARLERLLTCQAVLTVADDTLRLMPRQVSDVAGASTVVVIQEQLDGVVQAEVELRREPEWPFGDREVVLVDLVRPHVMAWLRRLGAHGEGLGAPAITQRQFEILSLVRCGLSNKEIGRALSISEATVRKHLENAFERLGAVSRAGAVGAAFPADSRSDEAHV